MADPSRVLVLADDPLSRAGLAALCAAAGAIVVGQGEPNAEPGPALAVDAVDAVVVGSAGSDDLDADALRALAEGRPALVVLASTDEQAAAAWSSGARAVLRSAATGQQLAVALGAVSAGLHVSDPSMLPSRTVPGAGRASPDEELTPREIEVLRLLAEGLPNKTIARRLGITEHTVKFHVNGILAKLGASSRTEAAIRAARMGLIPL